MVKKFNLNLAAKAATIIASVLTIVVGIIFYITFEPPIITVVIPELDAFMAWTVVAMVLGTIVIVVTIVNHFTLKKKWWNYILIGLLILAIILEIALVVLLFKNTSYIENYTFLFVLSLFAITLYMASLATLSIQIHKQYTKK